MAEILPLGESNFQSDVLEANQPVVVDFSAVWCGPCKMLDPVLQQLAGEWEGKARFFRMDVDDNANLAMEFGVMGVPTVMLFVDGKPVERLTGYQPKDRIKSKFLRYISA